MVQMDFFRLVKVNESFVISSSSNWLILKINHLMFCAFKVMMTLNRILEGFSFPLNSSKPRDRKIPGIKLPRR